MVRDSPGRRVTWEQAEPRKDTSCLAPPHPRPRGVPHSAGLLQPRAAVPAPCEPLLGPARTPRRKDAEEGDTRWTQNSRTLNHS